MVNNKYPAKFFILAIVLLLLLPLKSICDDLAKLPYDMLFKIQENVLKTIPKNQPFYFHIFSNNPKITHHDISLFLVTENEKIEIHLDKRGFIDLPNRPDLLGHGAFIISNQPKGSMVLQGELRSKLELNDRKIEYNELISPVIAVDIARKISENTPNVTTANYIDSIFLYVEQTANMPVIISLSEKNQIKLFPDENGNVKIPIEKDLKAKNPIIEFPSDNVFVVNQWK